MPALKIGLTYTGTEEKHNNYVNWLKESDDIEIIRLSAEEDNLDKIEAMDAIVLSGGVDAHPKNYGSNSIFYDNAPAEFNEKRDGFETAVFKESQKKNLPVLGVCRGMQLINCILGGDLTQDIGPAANTIHRNEGDDKKHTVQILDNTLLKEIAEVNEGDANSAHHQVINKVGAGLIVNSISPDGFTEGIEWENKAGRPFLLGVQWHPERMYKINMQSSPLSKNIRDYFIREIRKSKGEIKYGNH